MKKIAIIIIAALTILVGSAAVGYFVFLPKFIETASAAGTHKDGPIVSIGDYTIPIKNGSFFKTSISVEGFDDKSVEILTAKDAMLKDRVNTVLLGKTLTDIDSVEAKEKLREELLKQLNEVSNNQIQQVLFTSYVYQ